MVRFLTLRRILTGAMLTAIIPLSMAKAEASGGVQPGLQGWYAGVEGGMPFGFSTFSSFAHDKTHLGWAAGIYGGYRFNAIFSVELSAKYGKVNLSVRDCCAGSKYWLGRDGVRYMARTLDMDCWEYARLKSHVATGQYGARVNVNVLGLFRKTSATRWDMAVSPHVYAVTTRTGLRTTADGAEVMKGAADWHLGYGADWQLGCRLGSRLQLGIYSGVTLLTGKRMDRIPEHLHKDNLIWESGIRLGISLAKKKKVDQVEALPVPQMEVLHEKTPPLADAGQEENADEAAAEIVGQAAAEQPLTAFPVIHFAFNSTDISQNEKSKLDSILYILDSHPDMTVTATGWCDTKGSVAVNRRISRRRAETVKAWLVGKGVAARRISTAGNGSDATRQAAEARRVEIMADAAADP